MGCNPSIFLYLRIASEHFDKVIVKVIIKLSLKIPLKSSGFKLSGNKMESVRIIVNPLLFELDDDLDASIHNPRLPLEQRVFVPRQFLFYF